MIRVIYRYAVLSFCEDLTDPKAESVPVAIAGVFARPWIIPNKWSLIFLAGAVE